MRKLNLIRACLGIALFLYLPARADTFTVVSTAPAGPGSLRDAIEKANANGTAVTDYIYFNITRARNPVIQIAVNAPLPALTSNIVIDGTTQTSPALGVSQAKIHVSLEGRFNDNKSVYSLFVLEGVEQVAIYGLFLSAMVYDPGTFSAPDLLYAVYMKGCRNITIGDAGKGNLISGWNKAVYSEYDTRLGESRQVVVKGNIFGVNTDGISPVLAGPIRPGFPSFPATNTYGVVMDRDVNIFIGGETAGEGNRFNSANTDIFCKGLNNNLDDSIYIINNQLGVDINGGMIDINAGFGIRVHHYNKMRSTTRATAGIVIRKNYIAGKTRNVGIQLNNVKSFFAIEQNLLGSEVNGLPVRDTWYGTGIQAVQCDMGIIGDIQPGNENIIRYWKQGALICDLTSNITFRYNSTWCNKKRAVELNNWEAYNDPAHPKPFVTINVLSLRSGTVMGTATPHSTVDLYFDDDCPNCEGKEHLGDPAAVVQTDANGQWSYSGTALGNKTPVATATDLRGATSEYSAPSINAAAVSVDPVFCAGSTGSVCGLQIISGTQWEWRDENGQVVGRDTCLTGVRPGRYFLWLSMGPSSCAELYSFRIPDSVLAIDSSAGITATNTRCGKSNGSLCGFSPINAKRWQWEDGNGNVISRTICLLNVPPGSYRFRVLNDFCDIVTNYYTISDVTPGIDAAAVQITPTTCSKSNGSITGIVPRNILFSTLQWIDGNRNVAGTGINLVNVPAGRYKLIVLDQAAGCGDSTAYFTIPASADLAMNSTTALITHGTCNNNNGSITNISIANVTGTVSYTWVNESNQVAGNNIDLLNAAPGRYRLKIKDQGGCDTLFSSVFEIKNNGGISLTATGVVIKPAGCTKINGSITGIRLTGATGWEWRAVNTNTVVSNDIDLINVPAGNYRLLATNTAYGCSEQSGVYAVPVAAALPVTVAQSTAKDATCNNNNGSIVISQLNPGPAFLTFRWLQDSISPVGTSLSLTNLSPATYHLVATDTNGCEQAIYKRVIIMQPLPALDENNAVVKPDTCAFGSGSIAGLVATSRAGNIGYEWFNTANALVTTSKNATGLSPGTYYLLIKDINGCTLKSQDYTVGQITGALPRPQYEDVTIPRHAAVHLKVVNPVSGGTYELYDAITGLLLHRNTTGNFDLAAVSGDRQLDIKLYSGPCSSPTGQVRIKVLDITKLEVPNIFSPNGDGINDEFRIRVTGYFLLNGLTVYNRWGQPVFWSKDLGLAWDGRVNGASLPVGAYYYIIEGLDVFGKPLKQAGYVTLIR